MANYEYTDNIGTWLFHSLIESVKFNRMSFNEEANHQNKPRSCHQFESTFVIDETGGVEGGLGDGQFQTLASLEPEYTVLLFGVNVVDSDEFAVGEVDSSAQHFLFPTGAGIGPFLRPPIMLISPSAFAITDANGGRDWQTATVTAASDESNGGDWLLAQIGIPFAGSGLDNFKAGMQLGFRIAGFDGEVSTAPAANTNYYCFWHAMGSVAAYS